jgi:hypothetical protein
LNARILGDAMKKFTSLILLLVLAVSLGLTSTLSAADQYGAVAYCRRTAGSGSANGCSTKAEAIARAIAQCGQRDVVTRACQGNEWIALAVSFDNHGGYGWATASTAAVASSNALAQCRVRNPDAHIVLCISAHK